MVILDETPHAQLEWGPKFNLAGDLAAQRTLASFGREAAFRYCRLLLDLSPPESEVLVTITSQEGLVSVTGWDEEHQTLTRIVDNIAQQQSDSPSDSVDFGQVLKEAALLFNGNNQAQTIAYMPFWISFNHKGCHHRLYHIASPSTD